MLQKKMFKVICPIEKSNGTGTWWMRCGSGFLNKDNSINVYLDALPVGQKDGIKLQIRELTEEDLRERAEKRSTYAARGTLDVPLGSASASAANPLDQTPF